MVQCHAVRWIFINDIYILGSFKNTIEEESKESKKEERDDKRPKKNYNPNWKKDKAAEKPSLPNVGDDKSFPKLG